MKIQDGVFIALFCLLVILKKRELFVYAAIACFLASFSLFAAWIFFTAERLTWYAAAFMLVSVVLFTKRAL